ncbi:cytochrome c biogenesis protein CcdA, partial [Candidatus Microgenomates bacterium]|nr:cytochrome c biogenesis protein CcdA [Candidatus Microgenomates bacterium]
MDLLFSASFIASFFAGIAALFAPCCITVLLPTYFASIFKEKSTIYLMTFVYFLGLLAVFLPIGLGASFLTQLFSQYHNTIYLVGSVFLIFLGLALVTGQQLSLPSPVHPSLKTYGLGSVFVLGIFSGIATTCCAPVLAGVVA